MIMSILRNKHGKPAVDALLDRTTVGMSHATDLDEGEDVELNEFSKGTLRRYIDAADKDMDKAAKISEPFTNWKATKERMKLTSPNAIYMHCLPVDRGLEVENEVIDGPQSAVMEQAENRLHVQKALLSLLINNRDKKI